MNGSLGLTKAVTFLCLIAFLFSSCSGSQNTLDSLESPSTSEGESGGSGGSGSEETPEVPSDYNTATEFFVTLDAGTTYPHYVSQLGSYGTRCAITNGTTPEQAMDCVIDAPELGFYFGGAELALNVPSGMCEYTRVTPYWYYNNEIGVGPTAITVEKTTTTDENNIAIVEFRCSVDGSPLDSSCAGYTEVDFDGGATAKTARCKYDRTSFDEPNCCLGTVDLTSIDISFTTSGGVVTNSGTSTSNSTQKWGGQVKDCVGGQGKTNWSAFSKTGYPLSEILETRSSSTLLKYTVMAPIVSVGSASNIPIANYYTSITLGGASDEHTHGGSDLPYYVAPLTDRSGDPVSSGNPYYEFTCLDDAHEAKHRIRLYLREWDTYSAFNTYKTTGTFVPVTRPWDIGGVAGGSGDGAEGTDCDGLSPEVCNDFKDADNFIFDLGGSYLSGASTGSNFPKDNFGSR